MGDSKSQLVFGDALSFQYLKSHWTSSVDCSYQLVSSLSIQNIFFSSSS